MNVDDINWESMDYNDRAVLCYIQTDRHILLIHKKTGLGAGKINAPGGRIEPGETEEQAAIRETEEETGIIPGNLVKMAELHFQFTSGYSLFGSVFSATTYSGKIKETNEAIPFWVPCTDLPYDRMWEDDKLWLPMVLGGTELKGYFIFADDTMLSSKIIKTRFNI